jgi:hypothetical protein
LARIPVLPEATPMARYPPLGEVPVRLLIGCADAIGTSIFGHTNLRANGARQTPNMPFQRLEKNTCGVPEEKLSLPDVARKHGVRGVAGLLPDLESGDARPSSARRKAGA